MRACSICGGRFSPRDQWDGLCPQCCVSFGYGQLQRPKRRRSIGFTYLPAMENDIVRAKETAQRNDAAAPSSTTWWRGKRHGRRWRGHLGEILFDCWLGSVLPAADYEWVHDAPYGVVDFTVLGHPTNLKTENRRTPMRLGYNVQVAEQALGGLRGELFFACFNSDASSLCLVGGISVDDFRDRARLYEKGERVNEHYTTQNPAFILCARELAAPEEWLAGLSASRSTCGGLTP